MNNTIKFSVNLKNNGKRLDIFLAENIKIFTRSYLKKLIENQQVLVNNLISSTPSMRVRFKDQILINATETKTQNIIPKKIKLNIIYEDKDILVINKPKDH